MTNKHIFNGKVHFSDCFYCVNFMGVGGLQTEGGCTLPAGKIKKRSGEQSDTLPGFCCHLR